MKENTTKRRSKAQPVVAPVMSEIDLARLGDRRPAARHQPVRSSRSRRYAHRADRYATGCPQPRNGRRARDRKRALAPIGEIYGGEVREGGARLFLL